MLLDFYDCAIEKIYEKFVNEFNLNHQVWHWTGFSVWSVLTEESGMTKIRESKEIWDSYNGSERKNNFTSILLWFILNAPWYTRNLDFLSYKTFYIPKKNTTESRTTEPRERESIQATESADNHLTKQYISNSNIY